MVTINLILMILAFVCFILATVGVPAKINLVALGLAMWVLAILIGGTPR